MQSLWLTTLITNYDATLLKKYYVCIKYCVSVIQLFACHIEDYHFNTNNKYFECKICSFHKKTYLCTAIKAGSVAQLDRATPF